MCFVKKRILAIYIYRSSNSRSYEVEDFLNRPLSRLRRSSRIIYRIVNLRDLVLFVVRIRIYFYLYSSINS